MNGIFIFILIIGSIPFGLIIAHLFKIQDPRNIGSGNIGATNMTRSGGRFIGALTFLLDAGKGSLAVIFGKHAECILKIINIEAQPYEFTNAPLCSLFMLFAIIGHTFPIWLRFKGGKGVSTFFGCLLVFDIFSFLFGILTWIIVFYIKKIASIASVISTISSCVIHIIFIQSASYDAVSIIIPVVCVCVITLKHISNIKKLLTGRESSFIL